MAQAMPQQIFVRAMVAFKRERQEYANTPRNNACFGVHRALFAIVLNRIIKVVGKNPTTTWKTQTTMCVMHAPPEFANVFLLFCIKAEPVMAEAAWYLAGVCWPHLYAEAAAVQCARARAHAKIIKRDLAKEATYVKRVLRQNSGKAKVVLDARGVVRRAAKR